MTGSTPPSTRSTPRATSAIPSSTPASRPSASGREPGTSCRPAATTSGWTSPTTSGRSRSPRGSSPTGATPPSRARDLSPARSRRPPRLVPHPRGREFRRHDLRGDGCPDHAAGDRPGDQHLRHRGRLRGRRERADHRPVPQGHRPARPGPRREQALLPHRPRAERPGTQPAPRPARLRGLAPATPDRPHRPLPHAPDREPGHAHRGDPRGPDRPRAPGQGHLRRVLHLPGVAGDGSARRQRAARLRAVRRGVTPLQPAGPARRERADPALPEVRARGAALVAAGHGPAGRALSRRRVVPRRLAGGAEPAGHLRQAGEPGAAPGSAPG